VAANKGKQALLFLKKKKQKDFFESGPRGLSNARLSFRGFKSETHSSSRFRRERIGFAPVANAHHCEIPP
jgi:hypothetical protein